METCRPARRATPGVRLPDGLSGFTYLAQGWLAGSEGFSETHTIAIVQAEVLNLAWMIWLIVVAWQESHRPFSD